MNIGLAWVNPKDPTDRAIVSGLAPELERLGHRTVVVGPDRRWTSKGLLELHRRERIDLWHCHVFGRGHEVFARAARLGRFPLLASLHLVLKDYLPFLGGKRGLRGLLASAARVTVPNEAARREFLELCPEWRRRTSVVPYGIGAAKPAPSSPRGVRRPFILSAARLAPYKGIDLLLMAFAQVAAADAAVTLVLCGRDQLDGGILRLAKALGLEGRVAAIGERSPEVVARLMRDCEFLVMPSRRENLPLAALEAMAMGTPVVAAAVGGLPSVIRDGREGFLVASGDVGALARRMEALLSSGALRERMGRAARRRSRRFSWRRAALSYDRLYAAVRPSARRPSGMRWKK